MLLHFALTITALILPTISIPSAQAPLFPSLESLDSRGINPKIARENGPQLFNAIHSSARQWGSSINNNGMSLYPARIPNNTHLYHGTHTPNAVKGMEWLAFEVEHAEIFARTIIVPKRPPEGSKPPEEQASPRPWILDWLEYTNEMCGFGDGDEDDPEIIKGYLHIYRTTRPLTRLLYIDGMSAGKTVIGTLDTQDRILRNVSESHSAWLDYDRGHDLCDLGARWGGIDGFVRMEMGFEIIFCDFSDGLVLESVQERASGKRQKDDTLSVFEVFRGASLRYPGIAAQRLKLDYSNMVSAYWYDFNLTNPDPERSYLPRIPTDNKEVNARMKDDLKLAFEESAAKNEIGFDWQGVTDMIVTRYSDRLKLMIGNEVSSDEIWMMLGVLINLYIDFQEEDFDIPTAIEKCSLHYLTTVVPQTVSDHLIFEAVLGVTNRICSTLFHVQQLLKEDMEAATDAHLEESKSELETLVQELDWSIWRECGKCAYDEFCFTTIWPFGTMEDHEHPSCVKSEKDFINKGPNYWGLEF